MTNVINLRTARKRAVRQGEEKRAAENRLTYGLSKQIRKEHEALNEKADRDLEQHRLSKGDA
jgi:hypothetical protein